MSIFIKFDGIDGECKDETHEKWIDVLSVSFSSTRAIPSGATGQTRRRANVVLDDLMVAKEMDSASLAIQEAVNQGRVIPEVLIHFTASYTDTEGAEARKNWYQITLKNVMVSSYSFSAVPDSPPSESFALNYEHREDMYSAYDETGKKGGESSTSWDVEAGKKA